MAAASAPAPPIAGRVLGGVLARRGAGQAGAERSVQVTSHGIVATVRPHAVGYREATAWSVFYIAVAGVFGLVFASQVGWGYGAWSRRGQVRPTADLDAEPRPAT
jgi:hypothetical protein